MNLMYIKPIDIVINLDNVSQVHFEAYNELYNNDPKYNLLIDFSDGASTRLIQGDLAKKVYDRIRNLCSAIVEG